MSDDVLFHRVRIRLDEPVLDDVAAATDRTLADCGVALEPGSEVAITIGSRGIGDLTTVVGRVIAWVRAQGASPFLVPAMGSHGGATAEASARSSVPTASPTAGRAARSGRRWTSSRWPVSTSWGCRS
jgi:hypothetical protein